MRLLGYYSHLILLAGAFAASQFSLPAVAQTFPPRIFYSDLESGPNIGGENNNGAYVTIYGKRFGSSQGSSYVTIGGGRAASYKVWSDTKVSFQLGPATTSGNITITTSSGTSNTIPFTVRSGNIYFVATNGNDNNPGTASAPWATLLHARDTIVAGDIVYARNGVAQTKDDGSGWNSCMVLGGQGGTAGNPMAFVVYPGETATIGNVNGESSGGCTSGVRNKGQGENYWVLAGFNLRGQNEALDIGYNNNWRVVANDMTCPNGNDQAACFDFGPIQTIKAYGNTIHDVATNLSPGSVTALYHGVYMVDGTSDVDFGWNTVERINGCRGIQENSSTTQDAFNLQIHDNVIHDTQCDGIVLVTIDPSKPGGVNIWNNTIYNAGKGPNNSDGTGAWRCIGVTGYTASGTATSGTVEVYNNTMYGCGTFADPPYTSSSGGVGMGGPNPNKRIHLRNNIIYQTTGPSSGYPYVLMDDGNGHECADSDNCNRIYGSNNLFYGNGPAPSNTNITASLNTDPLFVNTSQFNFQLSSSSPAANKGTSTPDITDTNGIVLGSTFPIGAYAVGGSQSSTPTAISVSVTPQSTSLQANGTAQLTASVTGSSNQSVTWSLSSNTGTISSSGLYTAPSSISTQQTVTVKATSVADSTKSASATVTLIPTTTTSTSVSVSVTPQSTSLQANGTAQLTASVTGSSNQSVTWSLSSNTGTISSSGLYTAPSSISTQQTVTVKATSVADSTKSASATVTLIPTTATSTIVSVSVTPQSGTLQAKGAIQLTASVAGTSNQSVTWSLSPNAGSISSAGLYTAPSSISTQQVVTIKATSTADPTKSATAALTLVPATMAETAPPPSSPQPSNYSLAVALIGTTQAKITWTAPAGANGWLSLSSPGAPDWWNIWAADADSTTGSFTVNLPSTPGMYEFRYHASGVYTIVATSAAFAHSTAGYSVTPAASTVSTSQYINFNWAAGSGRTPDDYIGLYKVGATSDQPEHFVQTMGKASGSGTLESPSTPGTYELRYVMGSSSYTYLMVVTSPGVAITN